eukprot:bmy_11636T0
MDQRPLKAVEQKKQRNAVATMKGKIGGGLRCRCHSKSISQIIFLVPKLIADGRCPVKSKWEKKRVKKLETHERNLDTQEETGEKTGEEKGKRKWQSFQLCRCEIFIKR